MDHVDHFAAVNVDQKHVVVVPNPAIGAVNLGQTVLPGTADPVTAAEEQRVEPVSDIHAAVAVVAVRRVIGAETEHDAVGVAIALPVIPVVVAPAAVPAPVVTAIVAAPAVVVIAPAVVVVVPPTIVVVGSPARVAAPFVVTAFYPAVGSVLTIVAAAFDLLRAPVAAPFDLPGRLLAAAVDLPRLIAVPLPSCLCSCPIALTLDPRGALLAATVDLCCPPLGTPLDLRGPVLAASIGAHCGALLAALRLGPSLEGATGTSALIARTSLSRARLAHIPAVLCGRGQGSDHQGSSQCCHPCGLQKFTGKHLRHLLRHAAEWPRPNMEIASRFALSVK